MLQLVAARSRMNTTAAVEELVRQRRRRSRRGLASPRTENELATIVRGAAKVRVVGAGHSFMPLCATTGTLVNLAELDSPIEVAATVPVRGCRRDGA